MEELDHFSVYGQANEGKDGDGKCAYCFGFATGDNCDHCKEGYTGPTCEEITCYNGDLDEETGKCSSCKDGSTGDNCNYCTGDYYGLTCSDKCNCGVDEVCNNGFSGTGCVPFVADLGGKKYPIVTIGNQTWMAQNIGFEGNSKVAVTCYKNIVEHWPEEYGCLYTYEDALKVCPAGWHLPTKAEFETLLGYVEKHSTTEEFQFSLMKKTGEWLYHFHTIDELLDEFGFGAMPSGEYMYKYDVYWENNPVLGLWTADIDETINVPYVFEMLLNVAHVVSYEDQLDYSRAVRCIHDSN